MVKTCLFIVSLVASVSLVAQTDLLFEDFQNGIPSTWTIINNDGNTLDPSVSEYNASAWLSVINPDNLEPADSVASCASYFNPEGTASRWLITPSVNLGTYGNYIHWNARSQDPSYPDNYLVLISVTGTAVSDFIDTIYAENLELPTWQNRTASISDSGYNSVSVHIAFVDNSYYGYKLYLDSIRIEKESTAGITALKPSNIDFKLYPNPTQNQLNIQCNNKIFEINIYNLSGQLIQKSTSSKTDVSFLQPGFYTIQVITDKGSGFQKFVKQ